MKIINKIIVQPLKDNKIALFYRIDINNLDFLLWETNALILTFFYQTLIKTPLKIHSIHSFYVATNFYSMIYPTNTLIWAPIPFQIRRLNCILIINKLKIFINSNSRSHSSRIRAKLTNKKLTLTINFCAKQQSKGKQAEPYLLVKFLVLNCSLLNQILKFFRWMIP